MTTLSEPVAKAADQPLSRTLTTPLVVLYGLGVTIGAGIYVLIGETAGRAGLHAPVAFLVAAVVMALTAAGFGELVGRLPVSAGEAAYVRHGFGSNRLALGVGLAVAAVGIVSAAAICIGAAGYIRAYTDWPEGLVIAAIVLGLALLAGWGIAQSVWAAAILTLFEIGGLVLIVVTAAIADPGLFSRVGEIVPPLFDGVVWAGILGASLLAFFAFVGFEDMVNIAEEVKRPERTLPLAIALTLVIAGLLYGAVATVSVLSLPIDRLAASRAPLALVFESVGGRPVWIIPAIAILATLNGVVVQIIMASRVLYGLARLGALPALIGRVHPLTRTPLLATAIVAAAILVLALGFPLDTLAEATSRITLGIFALVNLALVRIKLRDEPAPAGTVTVPVAVPVLGALCCVGLLVGGLLV